LELLSTDEELKTLVENTSQCIPAGGRYSDYVSQALQEVMVKVGNVLLRSLAVLFPEVYRLFINEALQRALVGHMSLDESDIMQEMPRRCLLSRLIGFFGKHLVFECKQRSCGVLLYRRGADLGVCLSKTLKLLQGTTNSVINYQPQCQEPAHRTTTIIYL